MVHGRMQSAWFAFRDGFGATVRTSANALATSNLVRGAFSARADSLGDGTVEQDYRAIYWLRLSILAFRMIHYTSLYSSGRGRFRIYNTVTSGA
jgi:hypothetical protein